MAEIFFRLFIPQQLIYFNPKIWRPDKELGWRHRENVNTLLNTGESLIHFATDENGYRISHHQRIKDKAEPEISIITIGDSFLEGLTVEQEYTIPEVLRGYLVKKYNKDILVVNAGVGGWNPIQYYLEAKGALSKKKYNLGIVFLCTENDLIATTKVVFRPVQIEARHRFRIPKSLKWQEWIMSVFYPINDFLETRSHLFIFLKNRFQVTLSKLGLTAYYFPAIFSLLKKESPRWEVTAKICKSIEEEFSKYDTPVFFLLLPASYQVHEDVFYDYIKGFNINPKDVDINQPNVLVAHTFRLKSLRLTDPLEYMRQKAKEGLRMYGSADKHFNENGHRVVAEYLAPIVELYLSKVLA